MSFFRNKKHSKAQFPTNSQSQSPLSPQSQSVYPWSAHATPLGLSPPLFPRYGHALSTSATAAGDLFLFGGYVHISRSHGPRNDLYVISTRDFSITLLKTSGDVPSPRCAHSAVLTSTTLLIWGGLTNFSDQSENAQYYCSSDDDSFYLLNLGTSVLFYVKTRSGRSMLLVFQYRESGPASWSVVLGPALDTTIP